MLFTSVLFRGHNNLLWFYSLPQGQVFVFFIMALAAAEVAVGLAIIVSLYRARQTTHVEDLDTLKF